MLYPSDLSIKKYYFYVPKNKILFLYLSQIDFTKYIILPAEFQKNQPKIYFLGIFFPTPTFSPLPLLLTKIPLPFGLYSKKNTCFRLHNPKHVYI